MKNKFLFLCLIGILFAAFPGQIHSQGTNILDRGALEFQRRNPKSVKEKDQRLYRTARTFLNLNRYENAIKILKDLLQRNPGNVSYYQTLLNVYLMLQKTSAADSLVKQMLALDPGNSRYQIDRANVLYRQGDQEEAVRQWQNILKTHAKRLSVYSQVANAMLQNRLFDQAIRVYLQAIEKIPKTDYLYQNIANLYKRRLMYKEAAQYFLRYLDKNPKQENFVFHQILSFNVNPGERREFIGNLKTLAKKAKHPDRIYFLVAQLYQRFRQFEQAYKIYRQLEKKERDGRYLFQFARAAQQDSSYRIALEAYQDIIHNYPKTKFVVSAYIGAVTSLYQLTWQTNDTKYARQAKEFIATAEKKYADHPEFARLKYSQGTFLLDYFFDVDAATRVFEKIIQDMPSAGKYRDRALLKLGECSIIKGDLPRALNTYARLKKSSLKGEALLATAQAYYFMQDWQNAGKTIEQIIQREGMGSEVTNDALRLQMRLSLAETNPAAVQKLAEADLLIYQRRKSEAVKKLEELVDVPNLPPLNKSEALLTLGNLSVDLKEIPRALDFCNQAILDSSLSLFADRHLFLMASIMEEHLQKFDRAFQLYKQLLELYPNSLLADQSRRRMIFLREEKLEKLP